MVTFKPLHCIFEAVPLIVRSLTSVNELTARLTVLLMLVPSITTLPKGDEEFSVKLATVVLLFPNWIVPPVTLLDDGVMYASEYVPPRERSIVNVPPDIVNWLPVLVTSNIPRVGFGDNPRIKTEPPDCVYHKEPKVLLVLRLICPLTNNVPPLTTISGLPADAYSMSLSLVASVVKPTFTVPANTSKRPCNSKSAPVELFCPILKVPPLADKHPEEGMVNAAVVVSVIDNGLVSRKVPLVRFSAAGNVVFNDKLLRLTASKIEFLSEPLFTVRISKLVVPPVPEIVLF